MKKESEKQMNWRFFLSLFLLVFSLSQTVSAQTMNVTGVVTDDLREPMIGVSVSVKGTGSGTITDLNGGFTVSCRIGDVIIFTYMGYDDRQVKVDSDKRLTIVMSENAKQLDEVVVVGYGVQKKVNLTGSVASVNGEEILSRPNANALASLQGMLPGVAVLRSGGQPGSETSGIRIRGVTSTSNADALVLIDGVEGDISLLNPDDIENISVLKDAASSAIYGARAAAGVVLVTTKKGKAGQKPKITYRGSYGINLPTYMPERLPAWEEQHMINLSRINQSVNATTGEANGAPEQDAERTSWVGNPNYNYRTNGTRWDFFESNNWMNEGLDNVGHTKDHSVSLTGGSEKSRYYLSGGYYAKDGILKYGKDDNQRINLRFAYDTEINKNFSLNLLAVYQVNTIQQPARGSAGILSSLYSARGRQPIYMPEEDTNYETNPYNGDLQTNPIDLMKNGGFRKSRTETYTGKAGLHVKDVVEGLTLDLNFSRKASYYNYEINARRLDWLGKNGVGQRSTTGNNYATKNRNYSYLDKYEALVNYDRKIRKHSFHLLGGASYEQYILDQVNVTAENMLSNDFFSFNFYDNAEATNTTIKDIINPWKMASLFGRLNYNFDERYLFEANVRYDGSSRLDPSSRWGVFPSFSAAWRINQEPWFEPMTRYVGNLKFRASWGELGNSSALASYGNYPYLGLITNTISSTSSTVINIVGNPAYWQSTMASSDLTWETIQSTNIGIDLGLFNNRLNVTADYYWKKNKDMMAAVTPGSIIGASVPLQNVGEMKTWGWEISVNWNHKIGDVSYQIGFNIDDPQNKVTKYVGSNTVSEGTVSILEGYPVNSIWGYKTDGYWSSRQEYLDYKANNPGYSTFSDNLITGGDVKYLAQGKADHTIGVGDGTPESSGDLVYMGTTNGRYLFGINLGAQWKGFDVSLFFQGVGKRKFLINAHSIAPLSQTYEMPWTIHRDYWTEDNPNAFFPRLVSAQTFNYKPSDKWLQDGKYIRLKNIQVGYTIPVPKKIVQTLRVYIAGTDIWEHSDVLSVYDPEVGNNTQKSSYYPFFRTWTTGVNITF